MASIIPGFEYDIFISYRQKDNKYDGWVTEFIENLKKEIEATFKEDVSIYFDSNPHDGLLETHNVNKSLEGKLKCLIFIPILSQTYCDPKSFAWRHEFVAFNKLSKEDQLGRDIKLTNGNVASRILPIKIHDLDAADKATIEKEIGGALRAIDFIYKEPGVNRPLKPADQKADNQNKTDYRNQVNKVANAVKELLAAIQQPSLSPINNRQPITSTKSKNRSFVIAVLTVVALALAWFAYSKLGADKHPTLDKSIAVLPFADLSQSKDQEYFSDGLTEELLDLLSRQKELRVIGRTSSFAFKGKNEDLRTIGEKLGVSYILEGSVRKSGPKLRITTQLIKADDGSHIWSETFEREVNDVFGIYDEIASNIVKKLDLTFSTLSRKSRPEVYDMILQARYLSTQPNRILETKELWQRALALDSTDARIWAGLANYYGARLWQYDSSYMTDSDLALRFAERAVALDPNLADARQVMANMLRNRWEWQRSLEQSKIATELNPTSYGMIYMSLGDLHKQLEVCKVAVNSDPLSAGHWRNLAATYFFMGNYQESIKAANQALKLVPNYSEVHNWIGRSYISQGRYDEALREFKLTGTSDSLIHPAVVYALKGDLKQSDSYINRIDRRWGVMAAYPRIYAARGETDKAFAYLDTAYQKKSPFFIQLKVDPYFDKLRKDPRYTELLRKLNLPLD